MREDTVEIFGSKRKISFSVFNEESVVLSIEEAIIDLLIDNPENIQLYHVENIREQLIGNEIHPLNGNTASHTAWLMDKIVGNI